MIRLSKEEGFKLLKKLYLRRYLEHILSNPCKKCSLSKDFTSVSVKVANTSSDYKDLLYETSIYIFDEQEEGTYETNEFFIFVYKNGIECISTRRSKHLYEVLEYMEAEKENFRFIVHCSIEKEHYWDDIWPARNTMTIKIARADKVFKAFREWQEERQKLQEKRELQGKQVIQEQVAQKCAGKGFWNRFRKITGILFARG